jgi:hypothetical protein
LKQGEKQEIRTPSWDNYGDTILNSVSGSLPDNPHSASSSPLNLQDGLKNPARLREWLDAEIRLLCDATDRRDSRAIKKKLQEIVHEYTPQDAATILE